MTINRIVAHLEGETPWEYYRCVFAPDRQGPIVITTNNGKRYGRVETKLPRRPEEIDRELLLKMYVSVKKTGEEFCQSYRHLHKITTVGCVATGQVHTLAE